MRGARAHLFVAAVVLPVLAGCDWLGGDPKAAPPGASAERALSIKAAPPAADVAKREAPAAVAVTPRAEPPQDVWMMMDKSGSMQGFEQKKAIEPLLREIRDALSEAQRSPGPALGRRRYVLVGEGVKEAANEIDWIKQPYDQRRTDLVLALQQIVQPPPPARRPALALLVTDGLPAEEHPPLACPVDPSGDQRELRAALQDLIKMGYGLWLFATQREFDGPYYLECQRADPSLRQEIRPHFGEIQGCEKKAGCRFRYAGKRTLLAWVIADTGQTELAQRLVRALARRTGGATPADAAVQLWPPMSSPVTAVVRAAECTPPGGSPAPIPLSSGQGQFICQSPSTQLALELRLNAPTPPAEPLVPLLNRVYHPAAIPAKGPALAAAARVDPALDLRQSAAWLRPEAYPPGFRADWGDCQTAFTNLATRSASFGETNAEKQECPKDTCARALTICGCLKAAAQREGTHRLRLGLWAPGDIEVSPAALLQEHSVEQDAYKSPGLVYGLKTLLQQIAQAAPRTDAPIGRVEVEVTVDIQGGP